MERRAQGQEAGAKKGRRRILNDRREDTCAIRIRDKQEDEAKINNEEEYQKSNPR